MKATTGDYAAEAAVLSDGGTLRDSNEDHGGLLIDGGANLLAVADGVSSAAGGEVASQMAVEVLLRHYQEQAPSLAPGKRLQRAAQRANIEIHDRAMIVPELRGMATTLTAVVVDRGALHAVHVGDCRLYRVRCGSIVQLTKDHTLVAERVRLGILSKQRAKHHPDRSVLTRSLGPELIVALDRISTSLEQQDVVVCCSDGLYNVLSEQTIAAIASELAPQAACQALIDVANGQGTYDNVTAAVLRVTGPVPAASSTRFTLRPLRLFGHR
jgi:protein phosphatase